MEINKNIKLLVKGAYGEANLGDDILMLIIDNILKENFKAGDYSFLLDKKIPYLDKYLSDYVVADGAGSITVDTMLLGGGTQFFSFPLSAYYARIKLLKKALKNPNYLINYLKKRKASGSFQVKANKTIALGLGVGPFEGKEVTNNHIESYLKNIDYNFVRDSFSFNFLKSINPADKHISLSNDMCFAPDSYLPFTKPEPLAEINTQFRKATVIIRDWNHSKDRAYIKSVISFLKKNDIFDEIVVVLFGKDEYCENLLVKNRLSYLKWDPMKYSIDEFMKIIYSSDIVISSRYHGIVLSALYDVPFVPITIDPKLSLFSESMYEDDISWSYPYTQEGLKTAIDKLTNKWPVLRSNLRKNIDKSNRLVKGTVEEVTKIINN